MREPESIRGKILFLSHLGNIFSFRLDLLLASNVLSSPLAGDRLRGSTQKSSFPPSSDAPKRPIFPLKAAQCGLGEDPSVEDEQKANQAKVALLQQEMASMGNLGFQVPGAPAWTLPQGFTFGVIPTNHKSKLIAVS